MHWRTPRNEPWRWYRDRNQVRTAICLALIVGVPLAMLASVAVLSR